MSIPAPSPPRGEETRAALAAAALKLLDDKGFEAAHCGRWRPAARRRA
jgi:AcrR family transcriptional regulator